MSVRPAKRTSSFGREMRGPGVINLSMHVTPPDQLTLPQTTTPLPFLRCPYLELPPPSAWKGLTPCSQTAKAASLSHEPRPETRRFRGGSRETWAPSAARGRPWQDRSNRTEGPTDHLRCPNWPRCRAWQHLGKGGHSRSPPSRPAEAVPGRQLRGSRSRIEALLPPTAFHQVLYHHSTWGARWKALYSEHNRGQ